MVRTEFFGFDCVVVYSDAFTYAELEFFKPCTKLTKILLVSRTYFFEGWITEQEIEDWFVQQEQHILETGYMTDGSDFSSYLEEDNMGLEDWMFE